MTDEPKDHLSNPIIDDEGSRPYGQPVVDFGDIRIAHGLPKFHHQICKHHSLVYSQRERRIWCKECESTVDGFDAFMTITSHFQQMELAAQSRLSKADAALKATLVKRAAKNLDQMWNKQHPMAISCPHCRGGLLPEDFQTLGSATSRELELARRARKGAAK